MLAGFYRQKKYLQLPLRPPYHTFKNIRQSYDVRIQIVELSILVELSLVYSMFEAVSKKNVVPSIALG